MSEDAEVPKELAEIAIKVLSYKPKPSSDAAKKRQKKTAQAKRRNKNIPDHKLV